MNQTGRMYYAASEEFRMGVPSAQIRSNATQNSEGPTRLIGMSPHGSRVALTTIERACFK